jgi:aspartyl-tRNA(Asn)/glutamyl-tRNA(Gln) amidotransferase subunit A
MTLGWNVTGHPGVALPSGLGSESGLPTGIQLIARRGREVDAIQAGIDLQASELPPLRWPGAPGTSSGAPRVTEAS